MNQTSRSSRLATNLMLRTRRKPRVVPQGTIRFDQGDPYFNTPEPIRRALSAASVALAHGDELPQHRQQPSAFPAVIAQGHQQSLGVRLAPFGEHG